MLLLKHAFLQYTDKMWFINLYLTIKLMYCSWTSNLTSQNIKDLRTIIFS